MTGGPSSGPRQVTCAAEEACAGEWIHEEEKDMPELNKGMVVLTSTERVRFGERAAQSLKAEAEMMDNKRVFLIASD